MKKKYYCTSKNVGEFYEIAHSHVLEKISSLLKENQELKSEFFLTTYHNERNREYPIYKITYKGYIFVCFMIKARGIAQKNLNKYILNISDIISKKIEKEELEECRVKINKKEMEKETYVIYDNEKDRYKIGRTNNIKTRMKTFKNTIKNPELIFHSNQDIEKYLHSVFKELNIFGEWFKLSKTELEFLDVIFRLDYSLTGFHSNYNSLKKITSENSCSIKQLKKYKKLINFENDKEEIEKYKEEIIIGTFELWKGYNRFLSKS